MQVASNILKKLNFSKQTLDYTLLNLTQESLEMELALKQIVVTCARLADKIENIEKQYGPDVAGIFLTELSLDRDLINLVNQKLKKNESIPEGTREKIAKFGLQTTLEKLDLIPNQLRRTHV